MEIWIRTQQRLTIENDTLQKFFVHLRIELSMRRFPEETNDGWNISVCDN